jgi:geranylgeranyl diphosphate synthase, type II
VYRCQVRHAGTLLTVESDASLKAYQAACDARLVELLPPEHETPEILHQAMRYSALAPGKRLRPILCMAACNEVGGNPIGALDAACATELIHCFSLIHDDLPSIDNDELRRGRPTCHVRFGEGIAILAGDALFALAFEAILSAPVAPARCAQILARASGSGGLVGGEVIDILTEGQPFDEATLRLIHSRKTGALIAAACEIGAIIGGADDQLVAQIRAYGEHIGLAFQVADDILNETSTAEELGKSAGSDREREKATYPALFGLEESKRMASDLSRMALESLPISLRHGAFAHLAGFTVARSS